MMCMYIRSVTDNCYDYAISTQNVPQAHRSQVSPSLIFAAAQHHQCSSWQTGKALFQTVHMSLIKEGKIILMVHRENQM